MQPSTSGAPSTPNERLLYIDTPVGPLEIKGDDQFVSGVNFREQMGISDPAPPQVLIDCVLQLEEYFAGKRFDLNYRSASTVRSFSKRCGRSCASFLTRSPSVTSSWPTASATSKASGR